MTPADRLRALADSGTPGPWWSGGSWWLYGEEHPIIGYGLAGSDLVAYTTRKDRADAAKIVAAVNLLPAVAALVEAAEAEGHHAVDTRDETYCYACDTARWPCPTARALADLTAALGGEGL